MGAGGGRTRPLLRKGVIYVGRVGTGMPNKVLADLRRRLDPLD
jgi:ATP-dependent DNA ligase